MKLFRFGQSGQERPGAVDAEGKLRDISAHVDDLHGAGLSPESLARLARVDLSQCPAIPDGERLGACVAGVGNFIGVGLNYADHVEEAGFDFPQEPLLFNKAPSCIAGPCDDIRMPGGSQQCDWEGELALVIGSRANCIDEVQAKSVIAGYCICNDLSERGWQMDRGGQFMKGKGCPTFGPLGPFLVTTDDMPNPGNLALLLTVNGEVMQDGNTADMLFDVFWLVSYISRFMILEPGDVITTGTPAGVGMAKKPPRWLREGDVLELSVEGLGTQRQQVVAG